MNPPNHPSPAGSLNQAEFPNGPFQSYPSPLPSNANGAYPSPASPVHTVYSDYASPSQPQQWPSPHSHQNSLPAQSLPNGRSPFQPDTNYWQEALRRQQSQQPQPQLQQLQQQLQNMPQPASSNSNRFTHAALPSSVSQSPVFAPSPLGQGQGPVRTPSGPPPPQQTRPHGSAATFIDSNTFLQKLSQFMQQNGTPITSLPLVEGKIVDLPRLYQFVQQLGGSLGAIQTKHWEWLCQQLGFPPQPGPTPHPPIRLQQLQDIYQRFLMPFETYLKAQQQGLQHQRSASVTSASEASVAPPQPPLSARLAAQNPVLASPFNHSTPQQSTIPAAASPASQPQIKSMVEVPRTEQGESPSPHTEEHTSPTAKPPSHTSPTAKQPSLPPVPPVAAATSTPTPTPTASTSDVKITDSPPKATSQPGPTQRKRQKIQYTPIARAMDSFGGYTKEMVAPIDAARGKRLPRTASHLGTVEMFPLLMSLRSGIPSEQVYALNVINMLAQATRSETYESRLAFDFQNNSDLFEVLLDLLEESAFPEDRPAASTKRPQAPRTYKEHAKLAAERRAKFGSYYRGDTSTAVLPSQLLLHIINTLRTFATSLLQEHVSAGALFVRNPRFVDVLCRLCDFTPDEQDKKGNYVRSPVHLTLHDLLTIRKDVLCIFAEGAGHIQLPAMSQEACHTMLDLILFFLLDPSESPNPLLETEGSTKANLRIAEQTDETSAALSLLICMGGHDVNREILARGRSIDKLLALWESLLMCLPLDTSEHAETHRHDSHFYERIALALYNTAFIASPDVRTKMRCKSPAPYLILRVVFRNWMLAQKSQSAQLCGVRLMETLQLICPEQHERQEAESIDPNAPYFGGAFASPFEEQKTTSEAKPPRMTLGLGNELVTDMLTRLPPVGEQTMYAVVCKLFG